MSIQTIGYNPNFTQKAVSFRATAPDVVSCQNSEKKQGGMSTGAKYGIGLGLTALAATGIYVATKGKVGTSKQIAEHIDFTQAKTIEEARKFAKENFGIKLDLKDNLFMSNLVNECCVNVSNAMKGKACFPRKINFVQIEDAGGVFYHSNIISLNNKNMGAKGYDLCKICDRVLKESNNSNYIEYIKKNPNNPLFFNMRNTIYHGLGHCNHYATCKDYNKMGKLEELNRNYIKDKHYIEEFLANHLDTASKVSDYAKASPAEFVAETFAGIITGKTYPDDVMALYRKYNGPLV